MVEVATISEPRTGKPMTRAETARFLGFELLTDFRSSAAPDFRRGAEFNPLHVMRDSLDATQVNGSSDPSKLQHRIVLFDVANSRDRDLAQVVSWGTEFLHYVGLKMPTDFKALREEPRVCTIETFLHWLHVEVTRDANGFCTRVTLVGTKGNVIGGAMDNSPRELPLSRNQI